MLIYKGFVRKRTPFFCKKRIYFLVKLTPLSELSFSKALTIGFFQTLAIVPGVSRAGATVIGGLLLGLPRTHIVHFSFLLAIPTMLAATGFDL